MSGLKFLHRVTVKWPQHPHDAADPNEAYRPWLEENIGAQYVDWNWWVGSVVDGTMIIGVRKKHKPALLLIAMMWS